MPTPNMNDWELLQAYAVAHSERAFDLLVERYLDLVFSAAMRQVRDPHLAEEVCQAVFVILARKAGKVPRAVVLAGWLFRTTRFVAARAVRTEERRRGREREAAEMQIVNGSEPNWSEVEPLLDEAITVLPQKDRDAVLLRYFQRRNLREVGKELGTSEDGARKRVDRAVEKMRAFFIGKGLTLSAAFLVAGLSDKAMQAAPRSLAAAMRAASHTNGGLLQATALALATGVLKEMFWAKARLVLGAGTLAVITTLVATATWQSGIGRNHSQAERQSAALSASELRASVSNRDDAPGESARQGAGLKLPLLVVSAQRGQPLAGAGVMASYWQRTSENRAHLNFTTDELGHCAIPVSDREFEMLRIWISAPGHVPKVMDWRKYEFQAQPEEYVVRLEPGGVLGGVVRDEVGLPVSQAKLRVSGVGMVSSRRENIGYRDESSSVFSDEHGCWRFDQVPTGLDTLTFFVTHPDYAKEMVYLPLAPPGSTNHVVVMKRGVQVRGTVSNRFELPVFEAAVEEVDSYGGPDVSATTDLLGEFTLNHVKPGPLKLKIDAKGYKSLTRTVLITTNAEATSFVLEDAPPEERNSQSPPPVKTVRLAGTVKDEETGQPLDRFKVLLDERRGLASANFLGEGRSGTFDWEYPVMFFNEYALEIQADGYMPEASSPVKVSDGEHFFEFKLKKSADITGRVMFPDGAPAAGAEVWLGGENFGPTMAMTALKKTMLYPGNDDWSIRTFTDAQGAFRFQPRRAVNRVVVTHDWGCVAATMNSQDAGVIVLQPWGQITGVVRSGNHVEGNCKLGIKPQETASGSPEVPYSHNIEADGSGRFTFERVPPGKHRVYRITKLHNYTAGVYGISHYTSVEVLPGETSEIVIGGGGRVVVGRVNFGSHRFMPHWTTVLQTLALPNIGTPPTAPKDFSDANAMHAYHRAWNEHEAQQQRYYFGLRPDGSFVVEDVLPGSYRLQIQVTEPPKDPLDPEGGFSFAPEIGSLTKDIVVPEASADQPEQSFDLGVFTLQLKEERKTGE